MGMMWIRRFIYLYLSVQCHQPFPCSAAHVQCTPCYTFNTVLSHAIMATEDFIIVGMRMRGLYGKRNVHTLRLLRHQVAPACCTVLLSNVLQSSSVRTVNYIHIDRLAVDDTLCGVVRLREPAMPCEVQRSATQCGTNVMLPPNSYRSSSHKQTSF